MKSDSITDLKDKIGDESFNLILGEEKADFQDDLVKECDEMSENIQSSPLLVKNQHNSKTRLE